ncbi:MAG: hypothetical protein DA328_02565 [Nitrososphaeraceae archaeon]|nr:hypothetical protein [Nitrososphaeraceae archaeon]
MTSISIKSSLGGAMTGHSPTDRGKLGSKRHILTDNDGTPLSVFITSANTHDVTVANNTIGSIIIKRPSNTNINRIYVLIKHIIPNK